MLAKQNLREQERHSVRLHGSIVPGDRGATIISFSSVGCAFRTTAHLEKGQFVELAIAVKPNPITVKGEIVWTTEDYRIDTFYAYGMKFEEQISDDKLHNLLDLDAVLSVQNGPLFRS